MANLLTSPEIDNIIKLEDQLVSGYLDKIINHEVNNIEAPLPNPNNPLSVVPSKEKLQKEAKETLESLLYDRDTRKKNLRATSLIIKQLETSNEGKSILKKLNDHVNGTIEQGLTLIKKHKNEINKTGYLPGLNPNKIKQEEDTLENQDDLDVDPSMTLNEMFENHIPEYEAMNLSFEDFCFINKIAAQMHHNKMYKDAACAFQFISTLDSLCFETWFSLGACQLENQEYTAALQAFTAATIITPTDIPSHIYSASCYITLNDKQNAEARLDSAEHFMNDNNRNTYSKTIQQMRKNIK